MKVKIKDREIKNASEVKYSKSKIKIIVEKGNPEASGRVLMINGLIEIRKMYPVFEGYSFENPIAFSTLILEDGVIKAEMEIDVNKYGSLIPAISYKALEEGGIISDKITKFVIYGIHLSGSLNADESILSINEQLK